MKKKAVAIVLTILIFLGVCLIVTGCKEKKKYDVTIKIACKEVVNGRATESVCGEWIFTPDIDEMHIEQEYDGKQYVYYVESYSLPKHPTLDGWYKPTGYAPNTFDVSLAFQGQMWYDENPKYVCEKKNYCLLVQADQISDLWNYRCVRLYIDVM